MDEFVSVVAVRVDCGTLEQFFQRDSDQAVHDLVGHRQAEFGASFLEGFPLQVIHHVGYTACVVVSVGDVPGCTALHHFNFMDEFFVVRVPYSAAVVQ